MQESFQQPTHGGNLAWAASLVGCSPSAILDFSASINPLGPPASAIAAIQSHLSDLSHYPDPDYRVLRQALATAHSLPPEWILPGNGSAELLTWASRELAELDATYLLTPAFGDYLRALKAFDARVISCPMEIACDKEMGNWGDGKLSGRENGEMWRHKDAGSTSSPFPIPDYPSPITDLTLSTENLELSTQNCGILINNPHNPTGRLFTIAELLPLLAQFALVVVDEAFMDFLMPPQQQSLVDVVQQYPNLVILRSLTKFYSFPGLRLGYAIAHPERLQRWQQWRDPWSVNVLAIAAAIAVLQDAEFQHKTWNWLEPARSQLFQGLMAISQLRPLLGAANYLLVQSAASVVQLQKALLQRHQILIRDCVSFPELGDRFFRVAVRTETENQRLLTGLREILQSKE